MKILKFYSDTCYPCKMVTKALNDNNIEHTAINIGDEANESIISKYNVRGVPVLIKVDEDGNEINRLGGFPGNESIIKFCNEV